MYVCARMCVFMNSSLIILGNFIVPSINAHNISTSARTGIPI